MTAPHGVFTLPRRLRRLQAGLVVAVASAVIAVAAPARAEGTAGEAVERAQVEQLRAQMAGHLHLRAMNLVDELVLGMKQAPPVQEPVRVVVADVTGPFGYGAGFEALLENHLVDLLLAHADTRLKPVHCAACRAVTVHSTTKATVLARGVDRPDVLAQLGATGASHALFLDVEAEGTDLVLRAHLVALQPGLPIAWARALTSSTSADALLRADERLVTAAEARQEYLDALRQRGRLTPIGRVALVTFFPNTGERFDPITDEFLGPAIPVAPLYWIGGGAELAFTHNREWLASFSGGGSFLPGLYTTVVAQARLARLVGDVASLVWPNLYLIGGVSLVGLLGNEASKYSTPSGSLPVPDEDDVHAWPALHVGLDLRLGQRLGAAITLEQTPTLYFRDSIAPLGPAWPLQAHALGVEVGLWF